MDSRSIQELLKQKVHREHAQDLSQNFQDYACVALLLRGPADNLELGYIVRAENPHDRWSGQIAFPGGRRENQDTSDIATAVRETFEEIGLQLKPEQLIGKLNDVRARKGGQLLEFYIRPFVFYLAEKFETNLASSEVSEFFWQPLSFLKDQENQSSLDIEYNGAKVQLPAVNMNRKVKLWGLSYLMTQDILKTLG